MIPQLIWIVLVALSLGISFSRHGDYKEGKHNVWVDLIASLISTSILWWGGFFDSIIRAL